MNSKTPLVDFAKHGARFGVATQLHRINKVQADEAKRLEKEQGHAAACQYLVRVLFEQ
jgi:hypothetical protein